MSVTAAPRAGVQGYVSKGFEDVRDAFLENFSHKKELGAACCVYREGEKVVDLWGGIRNKATGELWEEDTMVLVYSATKGLAAMTLALAHSRGWLDYEERVCTYWPESLRWDWTSTSACLRRFRTRDLRHLRVLPRWSGSGVSQSSSHWRRSTPAQTFTGPS